MKKRILVISLALVLVVTALAPAAALANSGRFGYGMANTDFTGSGLIYVTYYPDPVIKGKIWRFQEEIVEGFLDQCDWELLAGAAFYSEHDSVVRVGEDGSAGGIMKGTFTLARPDDTGTLEGTFTGRISGNLYTGDISDTGTWRSTGGTGVFEGVKAWGKWSADLGFGVIPGTDIQTLVGPVTWEGQYMSPVNWQDAGKSWKPVWPWHQFPVKPGKPIKPWHQFPIKPGKPVKPWQPIKMWPASRAR